MMLTMITNSCAGPLCFHLPSFHSALFWKKHYGFPLENYPSEFYSVPVEPSLKVSSPLPDKAEHVVQARSVGFLQEFGCWAEWQSCQGCFILGCYLNRYSIHPFHIDPWSCVVPDLFKIGCPISLYLGRLKYSKKKLCFLKLAKGIFFGCSQLVIYNWHDLLKERLNFVLHTVFKKSQLFVIKI